MLDFAAVRRLAIISMFADSELLSRLVLKGGNALNLVHGIGQRTSLDVDFSLEGDFTEELPATESRLLRALEGSFGAAGFEVFDGRLTRKPETQGGRPRTWGGYRLEFKLIEKDRVAGISSLAGLGGQALVTGPSQRRTFSIEISRHEYCAPKIAVDLDGHTIYVYPPALIAIEKIRAICQQMPEYPLVRNKRARARDFYDIHSIVSGGHVNFASPYAHQLAEHVFAAKDVDLALIGRLHEYREFHRPDWPSVADSVAGSAETYDFYFDWLVKETAKLKPLWDR